MINSEMINEKAHEPYMTLGWLQAISPLLTIRSAEHETQDSSPCMREYRTVLYITRMYEQRGECGYVPSANIAIEEATRSHQSAALQ